MLKISIPMLCLKLTHLKSQPHIPGDNELNHWWDVFSVLDNVKRFVRLTCFKMFCEMLTAFIWWQRKIRLSASCHVSIFAIMETHIIMPFNNQWGAFYTWIDQPQHTDVMALKYFSPFGPLWAQSVINLFSSQRVSIVERLFHLCYPAKWVETVWLITSN